MTTYRLLYARTAKVGGYVPADTEVPHFLLSRGKDRRHGWLNWCVVNADHMQKPTEWRTLDGVTKFLDANPTLREEFDIVKVPA